MWLRCYTTWKFLPQLLEAISKLIYSATTLLLTEHGEMENPCVASDGLALQIVCRIKVVPQLYWHILYDHPSNIDNHNRNPELFQKRTILLPLST